MKTGWQHEIPKVLPQYLRQASQKVSFIFFSSYALFRRSDLSNFPKNK